MAPKVELIQWEWRYLPNDLKPFLGSPTPEQCKDFVMYLLNKGFAEWSRDHNSPMTRDILLVPSVKNWRNV